MSKIKKLVKVDDSLTINRYDNGWMVEIRGVDSEGSWKSSKVMCGDETELLQIVQEYNSMPIND